MNTAVLSISVPNQERLRNIFGPIAQGYAFYEVGTGIRSLINRVFSKEEILELSGSDVDGKWSLRFDLGLKDHSAQKEIFASIDQTFRTLMRELLLTAFGAGSGSRIPFEVSVSQPHQQPSPPFPHHLAAWLPNHSNPPPSSAKEGTHSLLSKIILEQSIATVFQPIVRLSDRAIVGHEALSRGPIGSPLERPDYLFQAAADTGRSIELELLCARLALERTKGKIPLGHFLTINLGPDALIHAQELLPLKGREDVIIELTEHLPLDQIDQLKKTIESLRKERIRFSLDDTGCGFADIDTAIALKPDIVKLCITIIRTADQGSTYLNSIRETAFKLHQIGCRVLAEGVESSRQHEALSSCQIELGQGWLYGKPLPMTDFSTPQIEMAATREHAISGYVDEIQEKIREIQTIIQTFKF